MEEVNLLRYLGAGMVVGGNTKDEINHRINEGSKAK